MQSMTCMIFGQEGWIPASIQMHKDQTGDCAQQHCIASDSPVGGKISNTIQGIKRMWHRSKEKKFFRPNIYDFMYAFEYVSMNKSTAHDH